MCGFVAFLTEEDGLLPADRAPEPWTSMVRHRGPDAQASHVEPCFAVHFARLKIIDLSEQGMQPMVSGDGRYVIAFNGEIVNYRTLAEEFCLPVKGSSDTKVLLEGYARDPQGWVRRLRGMFAFAVYDRREKALSAFRDPFGIKPLYYAQESGRLILSSEIRPVLAALGGSSVRPKSVLRYLRRGDGDDGEETFFRGVKQLMPGHRLDWKGGRLAVSRWFEPALKTEPVEDPSAHTSRYYGLLKKTVGDYLRSDVPVGVSLSGGFDSSLLAHLVRENCRLGQRLAMFTRGYRDHAGNEYGDARRVAELYGFDFHPVELAPEEVPSLLPACSAKQEQPVTSLSILAFHKLYRAAKAAGITVILEGHGGDELWAGYSSYLRPEQEGCSQDGSAYARNDELFGPPSGEEEPWRATAGEQAAGHPSLLVRRQLSDIYGGKLQRALRFVDRASMSEHVESREPFLDIDTALPALRLPDDLKIKDGQLRHFIRQAALPYLGPEIALKPKLKVQDPQRKWFQSELRGFAMDLLHSRPLYIEQFVDVEVLTRYYEDFMKDPSRFDNLTFLMFPLFLEVWHQSTRGSFTQLKEAGYG